MQRLLQASRVGHVAHHVVGLQLEGVGRAVAEAGAERGEQLVDLVLANGVAPGTQDADWLVARPERSPRSGVTVVQREFRVIQMRPRPTCGSRLDRSCPQHPPVCGLAKPRLNRAATNCAKAPQDGLVEPRGLEPLTPCLQSRCATNCAKAPGEAGEVQLRLTASVASAQRACSALPSSSFFLAYTTPAAARAMQQELLHGGDSSKRWRRWAEPSTPVRLRSCGAARRGRCLACVGLGGLEPPTSSLSGKRSNRLSYRPGRRRWTARDRTITGATPDRSGQPAIWGVAGRSQVPVPGTNAAQLSSARVTSMPPSSDADML